MTTSESNKVGRIIEVLKNQYSFSKDLLTSHPNKEDIKNKIIQKALSTASKTKKGKGKNPGKLDIYYCNEKEKFLFLAEVKSEIANHPKAIEDIKHYLTCFRELSAEYKIIGLAIAGDITQKVKHRIDTFIITKGELENTKVIDYLLSETEYLGLFSAPESKKTQSVQIRNIADEINGILYNAGLTTPKRITLISGALIALHQRKDLKEGKIKKKISAKDSDLNDTIHASFLTDIKEVLWKEFVEDENEEAKEKIETVERILKPIINNRVFKGENEVILAQIFKKLWEIIEISPHQQNSDLGATFYQTFLKYWTDDGQELGIVLTPLHITELMVDLIDHFKTGIGNEDIALDPCAGSGTFLLSFMNKQIQKYQEREQAKKNIIGIERDEDMYLLSIANMLTHGDGKANLQQKDFFEFDFTKLPSKPNIGLMNPPYSQKKNRAEILFVERLLEVLQKDGYAAVIVPTSTFNNEKQNREIKRSILKQHSLKAIINMPEDLFWPRAIPSCIAIFRTRKPQEKQDQVLFYNLKDDGFSVSEKSRINKFNKWEKIKNQVLEEIGARKEIKNKCFLISEITADDEWIFGFLQKRVEFEDNFSVLWQEQGSKIFEKNIGEYLLYKIKEKTGILDLEIKINEAENSKDKNLKEQLKKAKPTEWEIIERYLNYLISEKEVSLKLIIDNQNEIHTQQSRTTENSKKLNNGGINNSKRERERERERAKLKKNNKFKG